LTQRFLSWAAAAAAVLQWAEAAEAVLFTQDQHSPSLSEQTLLSLALVVLAAQGRRLVQTVVKLPHSVSPQLAVVVVVTTAMLQGQREPTEAEVVPLVVRLVLVVSQLIVAGRVTGAILGALLLLTEQAEAAAHQRRVKAALMVLNEAEPELSLPSTELVYTGVLAVGETLIT
tara:strand:+ start:6084 stop:6602 length:519 start_codon:yes stop_codon:yes gene_type:complete